MYGLSLFSGYGGIDIALAQYVRPLIYCDIEKYAQAILLSRMDDGSLPFAPIWSDVTTLDGTKFRGMVDIIYAGFPCQDLSVAGKGAGLDGKRSGLFFEIIRLAKEIKPSFIFLENVPAIRTRGLKEVVSALGEVGYDCRWTCISASAIGANHKRERWFLLAYSKNRNDGLSIRENEKESEPRIGGTYDMAHTTSLGMEGLRSSGIQEPYPHDEQAVSVRESEGGSYSDSLGIGCDQGARQGIHSEQQETVGQDTHHVCFEGHAEDGSWWAVEPDVGRVANGVKNRAHRIKALGNGVVPLQVKTAFEKLIGIQQ